MDCKKINSTKVLKVVIYLTPAGHCWFPAIKEAKGDNIFVGTPSEIAARIKELNKSLKK